MSIPDHPRPTSDRIQDTVDATAYTAEMLYKLIPPAAAIAWLIWRGIRT